MEAANGRTDTEGDRISSDKSNEDAGKKKTIAENTIPYYKMFKFADRLDMILMGIGTVAALGTGTMLPLMTILFGKLLNAFGQHQDPALHTVVVAVSEVAVEFVYIGVAAGACAFLQVSCWICTGERQAARIRQIYLKTILKQDIAFFDTATTTGEIIARMAGDTILIQEAMGEKVGKFLQLLATFCGGFIVAFFKCWKLTLVMLSAFPLLVLAGGTMAMIRTKMSGLGDQSYAEAGSVVEQTLGSIRTVVSFTGEKKAITSYETKLQSGYKDTVKQGIIRGFGMGALYFIIFSSYALALWYGSRLIINEGYSGGTVMNVVFAVLAGGMSLGQILPALNAFSAGKAAAYKMFETIKRKPAINVSDLSGLVPEDIQGDIELRNVYFRYPARPDVQVFSGFSLQIPGGTTAALVGESGSGKSTVISLIQRFYDPQVGQVLIDGSNIKKFQLKWLRQKTGLVSQEPVLFATTIRENMAYGKEEATMEEIKAAAEIANAAKFINRMPQGYETMVGEHGTQLSGGQKQRIAIARAILKNPRILLLDEATSALDAESERAVQEALNRIMANRTTVVVAHRLSTVKNADMIAVVQQGSIVEKGTHSQLIENPSGAYSQLIRLQGVDRATEQNEANKPGNTLKEESSTRIHRKRASSLSSFSSSEQETDHPHHHHQDEQNTNTRKTISSLWCFHRKSVQELEDAESGEAAAQKDVSFRRLASLNKPELPIFVLGCIAAVINGGVFPVFGLLLSSIISSFFEPAQELRQDADFWSLMFVVLAAVCFVVGPLQNTCFAVVGGRLVKRVRAFTFGKIVYQEIGWFDAHENSSGAVGARLSTDAANVRGIVGDVLSLACQNVATIAMGFAIAFASNWKLAFLVLALVPLLSLQGYIQMKSMKGFSADAKVMYEQASEVASGALGSIRTVASFCAEDKVMKLYNKKCSVPLKNGIRQGLISGTGYGFSNFVLYAAYALTFWVGSKMVQSGDTTFGKVYKVFFALTMTAVGVAQTSSLIPDLSKVKASVNSVFKILDRRSKIDASDASGTTLATVRGDIEFRHISFRYPTRRNMQIFTDLNLIVSAGKTVALVGESGSGKSTVISLLQRFYDPESGHIYLDGVDISKLQVKWLRQQMGLVSQEPVLFNDTIYANIAYGKDGPISENEIINAAKASNAHKFISSLPQGYTTNVGERGLKLSGGQKQRIAIARAIAKNPRILLMDEATSALDAESERSVQDALDNIMVNRSTIVVAHRLSTIKNAHLIVVVKNGVIAEQGLHDSLVAEPHGHYAALVKMNSGS